MDLKGSDVRAAVQRVVLVMACVGAAGCAPTLSTFVPAKTTPKGAVRASAGLGGSIPLGQIGNALDAADTAVSNAEEGQLTDEEKDQLTTDAAAVTLSPPSVAYEVQARYGLSDRFDAGVRFATGALRADGRFMFIAPERPGQFGASIGVGASVYTFKIPVPKPFDRVVEADDYRRYELDVPLLFGWSWPFAHVWFGPKALFATYSAGLSIAFVDEARVVDVSGTSVYVGGQAGAAIGYKHAWLGFELTVMHLIGNATIETPAGTLEADFSGPVVQPTLGLLLQFD